MARNTREADIIRFIELKEQEKAIKEELNALREQLEDDVLNYGQPDGEKENGLVLTIGKSKVSLLTVCKRVFDSARFRAEHNALYEKYKADKTENRISAYTDR